MATVVLRDGVYVLVDSDTESDSGDELLDIGGVVSSKPPETPDPNNLTLEEELARAQRDPDSFLNTPNTTNTPGGDEAVNEPRDDDDDDDGSCDSSIIGSGPYVNRRYRPPPNYEDSEDERNPWDDVEVNSSGGGDSDWSLEDGDVTGASGAVPPSRRCFLRDTRCYSLSSNESIHTESSEDGSECGDFDYVDPTIPPPDVEGDETEEAGPRLSVADVIYNLQTSDASDFTDRDILDSLYM